jgi:hypothetical protein
VTAPPRPERWKHDLTNQLGIVLGFSALLLEEMDPADERYADLREIHTAAEKAMEILAAQPFKP